jgi:Gram-negative bacterial TonB protein C-terminal
MKVKFARFLLITSLVLICHISTYAQFDSGLFAGCIYFDNAKQVEDCENLQMQDYFDSEILPFLKSILTQGNGINLYTYFYIDELGEIIDMEIVDVTNWEALQKVYFDKSKLLLPKVNNVISKEKYFAAFTTEFDKNNFLIKKHVTVVAAKDEVYKVVQFMPRFPGCEDLLTQEEKKKCSDSKMLKYIYGNLQYSEEAINKKVNNNLVVQFIIETDGYITDINVRRDFGYGCGQSARDVVESMNHMEEPWIAGSHFGRKVRVMYTLPIKFDVSNRDGFDYENDVVDTVSIGINNNKEYIYQTIEDMPFFPACPNEKNRKLRRSCGDAAMLQFVYKNIKTPLGSFDDTDSRRIRAFFVVEKDGSITNINVTGDTDNGVGDMVVAVIEKMNEMKERWIPGNVTGQNVRTQYELPINFRKE